MDGLQAEKIGHQFRDHGSVDLRCSYTRHSVRASSCSITQVQTCTLSEALLFQALRDGLQPTQLRLLVQRPQVVAVHSGAREGACVQVDRMMSMKSDRLLVIQACHTHSKPDHLS